MRYKIASILIAAHLCVLNAYTQENYSLSGTITDSSTGETMIGATVSVRELPGTGTISNAYGYYSLTLPERKYTVVISFVGFQPYIQSVDLVQDIRTDVALSIDAAELEEVVVMAERKNENIVSEEIGVERVRIEEIKKIPVLFGEQDVIKTLTLTPGVKTSGEGSGGMFVRGGNNSQNLVLLDEATVFNSNHLLGFFSTFNSDAIKDLTLYKGSAPSQYGGRISSVMDVKMNEGNNQTFHVGGGSVSYHPKHMWKDPLQRIRAPFWSPGEEPTRICS